MMERKKVKFEKRSELKGTLTRKEYFLLNGIVYVLFILNVFWINDWKLLETLLLLSALITTWLTYEREVLQIKIIMTILLFTLAMKAGLIDLTKLP